jgi:hypothetical protein
MLTVDQYARIRQLRRDGLTIRQIADQLHHSPMTILKALENPEPGSTRPRAARPTPVFGPFRAFVDEILAADESAPRKQRHTARQIHRRLITEKGYTGQYDQIRRYLRRQRLDRRETFTATFLLAADIKSSSISRARFGTSRNSTALVEVEPIRLGAGRDMLWASSPLF